MSTITVEQDDSVGEILELLKSRTSLRTIATTLVRGVNAGSQILQGLAVKERFTGQGPFPVSQKKLGVASNRLRRSIRFANASFANNQLTTSAGSNVKYFARHEFGGQGKVIRVKAAQVKEHQVRNAFGRGETITIAAHTRRAYSFRDRTPKREPLQASLREHATRVYGGQIEKQLITLLEGGAS